MSGERAVVIQHPSAPVTFDPVCDDSGRVIAPAQPQPQPRQEGPWNGNAEFEPLTDSQIQTLDAQEAIIRLATDLGSYRRLMTLVKSIAVIQTGERL